MIPGGVDPADVWADVALATEIFAVDPGGLGGIVLRAGAGPHRDLVCGWIRALLPEGTRMQRVPHHVTEERLLGGLSLAATLQAGRVVTERGLLAEADGGVLVLPMVERVEAHVVSHVCSAIDRGEISLERDGISAAFPCRVGVIALDEGIDDEAAPVQLRDRLALHLDLAAMDRLGSVASKPEPDGRRVIAARENLEGVELPAGVLDALCQAAVSLGVVSLRAPILAAAVARVHAALEGRGQVTEADAVAAARLVLGPRATRMPRAAAEDQEAQEEPAPPQEPSSQEAAASSPPEAESPESPESDAPTREAAALEEIVLAAAKSAIPTGLLALLASGREPRSARRSNGRAGVVRASSMGGRPAGTRAGQPHDGERLNVVETLRAAAPWQRLRRREPSLRAEPRRIQIRKSDFRVTRWKQRTETSVIFSVDASGSAALQRLAEAKGAVEQVLGDCYVRRDHVALIAFRGTGATLLLPPTRSLTRVRRCLAELAGGGTTPVASGMDAALALATDARARGKTPLLVMMTDGRANVARDGREGASVAGADALASARAVRLAQVRALFIDTSPRPRPQARQLAAEMGARYLAMPYLDAAGISRHVQALAEDGR